MADLPLNASINDVLEQVKSNIFSTLNCHNIGRIIEYNAETNTATIETMILRKFYNEILQPSLIMDVPILTFGTKNARITMPNPVGCYVVLLFMDKNIDNFLETGEQHLSPTDRTHSISDCVALLTIDSSVDEQPLYDENALTLSNKQNYIKIKDDEIIINAPISVSIDSPEVTTTGNLNVGTGVSATVPVGGVVLTFSNGILTGVS